MYVCNSNALTESEVDEAVQSGATDWQDVHEFHGCEPCCGKCEIDIADQLDLHRRLPEHAPEPFMPVSNLDTVQSAG